MNHRGLRKTNYKPLIWLLSIAAVLAVGYFALMPARKNLAQKLVSFGDEHLNNQQYVEAIVDYKKASWLFSNNEASQKIDLARKSQMDIQELTMFFRQKNNMSMLEMLNIAQKVPATEKAGLENAKQFIEINQPQLAEITAKIVLEMNDGNKEAWTYLGISKLQTARIVQMSEQNRAAKLAEAKEAFSKAEAIDNSYELAKKYLVEVEGLL